VRYGKPTEGDEMHDRDSSARTLHPFARFFDRTGEHRADVATDDAGIVYYRTSDGGRWQAVHSGLNANAPNYVTRCANNFGWSVELYDETTGDYYPSAEAVNA
jgi:hypothetical protein